MMRTNIMLFLCVAIQFFLVSTVTALPDDRYFYSPTIGPGNVTITPGSGGGNDTPRFIDAMNSLPQAGGVINVQRGTYRILNVVLRSNVHFRIEKGTVLRPYVRDGVANGNRAPMFLADSTDGIENFSILGKGGRFTIDLTEVRPDKDMRAILFANASNFKIARIHVNDNNSRFSAFAFTGNFIRKNTGRGVRIEAVRGVPSRGILANLSISGAHYGYGLIQVQVGHRLLFRKLKATGGVALRLETGSNILQFATGQNLAAIQVDDIWGRNIECVNGQSALQLSPHTIDQGSADVSNIKSTSCEFSVVHEAGFVSNNSEDRRGQADAGLTPGSFSADTRIRNITATFGQNAQLHRSKRLRYMPCPLRVARSGGIGLSIPLNADGESRRGPAIGVVLSNNGDIGAYPIDLPVLAVTENGFNIVSHHLPSDAVFRDNHDDYEVCNETINGINFFVRRDRRNTPNPRNPLE